MTTRMHSRMRPLPRKMNGDPTAQKQMTDTSPLQARPHDPSGNEPNFDELITGAAFAAATLGRPLPLAMGAR